MSQQSGVNWIVDADADRRADEFCRLSNSCLYKLALAFAKQDNSVYQSSRASEDHGARYIQDKHMQRAVAQLTDFMTLAAYSPEEEREALGLFAHGDPLTAEELLDKLRR